MAVVNEIEPITKFGADVLALLDYAEDNPDGFRSVEACDALDWYRYDRDRDTWFLHLQRFYRTVRGVRQLLADQNYNLISLPDGTKGHIFWLASADSEDDREANRVSTRSRVLDFQSRLRSIRAVNESLSVGLDFTTPEGRKVQRILKMIGSNLDTANYLIEDLNDQMENGHQVAAA